MNKYTIAFVGSGKLAKCFAHRLLIEKKRNRKKFLFVAPRQGSDMSWFLDNGFHVSFDYRELSKAELVVLLVTPIGVAQVLNRIKDIPISNLVSIISNLPVGKIKEVSGNPFQNIVIGTCNTNVAYGEGIIALAGAKNSVALNTSVELLARFGMIEVVNYQLIPRRVMTIGSDNAFNPSALEVIHKQFSLNGESFGEWLPLVHSSLKYIGKGEILLDDGLDAITRHLLVKANVWKSNFGYGDLSFKAVFDSFSSTVNALVAANINSYEGIAKHIALVATKGGCTERGLGSLTTFEDITNASKMAKVYLSVYNVVLNEFPKKVAESFEEYNSQITALQQIAQAHQKRSYVPE